MRVPPTSPRHLGEQRRYFPDWIERLLDGGLEVEADRNSYLAGGYSEEFGYCALPGSTRGVPVLDGESAEECAESRKQAYATHPGYPLKPHPLEVKIESRAAVPKPPMRPSTRRNVDGRGSFVSVWHLSRRNQRSHARWVFGAIGGGLIVVAALLWPRKAR